MESMDETVRALRVQDNPTRVKEMLDAILNELGAHQRLAIDHALEMRAKRARVRASRHLRSKRWWDAAVDAAYKNKVLAFTAWKETCFQGEASHVRYRSSKKAFRAAQALSDKQQANANYKRVEKLFRGDRSAMWTLLKDMTRPATANIDIAKVNVEFRHMFNTKLSANDAGEREAEMAVDSFLTTQAAKRVHTRSEASVSAEDVEEVLLSLSSGKSAGFTGMAAEAYKCGLCRRLVMLIKLAVDKMFRFNIVPHLFNIGLIMPIIKDPRQDHNDISNVRPITVSDTLANIYERLVLKEFERVWPNSGKQFGFKKHSSCSHAIVTLRETALLRMKTHGAIHVCAIDASKAFDKLNRSILWAKMIGRVDDDVLANLITYYKSSQALVVTKDNYSSIFKTALGVKQGGPLSPRLFAAYLEDLIADIDRTGMGVHAGTTLVNILLYADDIILVANNLSELQRMLEITEDYGRAHEITFNAKKTVYCQFGGTTSRDTPRLNNVNIDRSDELKYLGVTLTSKMTPTAHLITRKRATMARMSALRAIGINSTSISVQLRLLMYKVYVRPVLLYGVETQSLNKEQTNDLQVFESTIVKRLVGISKYCHSSHLIYASSLDRIEERVAVMKLDMIGRLMMNQDTRETTNAILRAYEGTQSKTRHRLSMLSEAMSLAQIDANEVDQFAAASWRASKDKTRDVKEKQGSEEVKTIRRVLEDLTITDETRAERLSIALRAG